MEKYDWIPAVIVVVVLISILGCSVGVCIRDQRRGEKIYKEQCEIQKAFFDGYHVLRCLGSKSSISGESEIRGSFLGFRGRGNISPTEAVKFIWINEDTGELIPTVLPVNKVRIVELEEGDSRKPHVEFSWWYSRNYGTFSCDWVEHVCNATIYIRPAQIDDKIYFKFDTN